MEFKGTKGKLELQYVNGICIGIGTIGNYSQITANTILPDTDEEYYKEQEEIEANMQLYASAPELLEALQELMRVYEDKGQLLSYNVNIARKAIEKATNTKEQ